MQTGKYLHLWLEPYIVPFKAANTAACYRRSIAALPSFVLDADLMELDALELQCALNQQAIHHPRAALLTFSMLHAAFARAVKLGYMTGNKADACDKPQHSPR